MGKFAKLFDIGGEQLLVVTKQNDDGHPQVECSTEIDGHSMAVGPVFKPNGDSDKDWDVAWRAADKYLDSFDQEKAEKIRQGMVDQWQEWASEV